MVASSTLRRTVTISAHRSLGYQVPSSSANVFSIKALVAGPAHYQSPKQRLTRWMIDLATLNSPLAPAFLSPVAQPESVYSPSKSPTVSRFSLSVSSVHSSISSSIFRTPVKIPRSEQATSSASYDLEASLDRMHDLIAGIEAQEQLSPLIDSTLSQPTSDSITLYTNTSGSAQTWKSQAASNSDLALLSPCVRMNVSPASPASFEWTSLDSLTPPPASPASDLFASLLPVPATPATSPVSDSSVSTISFIPSPSFNSSIESVQYRSVPVFTTVATSASIPCSWVDDDCSWSDIIKPATVISVAVAAAAFAASWFW